ncbi:MAG: hypothetical protein AAGE94_16830 [Acidobacteriota bacterium]
MTRQRHAIRLRPAFLAGTLLMVLLAWAVVAAEDHGIQPLVGGEWQSRADVAGATDNPCDALSEVCVEWCDVASNGTVTPSGRLCCKPQKAYDPYDPTCAKPVGY